MGTEKRRLFGMIQDRLYRSKWGVFNPTLPLGKNEVR